MPNKGWSSGGGESVSSTTRNTGVNTDVADAEPFKTGSRIANPGANPGSMGDRSDLYEARGQLSET